uniref:cilia- and flagella-associated protein 97 isoform X3 n=1 Tax=Solea senegalensis TaxID=28829 RepID=UPI001CD87ADC|nr:cilia- and flagella-associated protein 97 isoform X3 [Solea senegalensis]
MFNPSELEGEVDHSFFDSDDDGLVRDKQKKMESPPAHERLQAKQMEKTKAVVSPRTDGTKQHLKQVNNNRGREGGRDNSYWSKEEERSRSSQVSSVASMSDKVISNISDSEEDDSSQAKRHGRTFMALLAESSEVHDKSMDESDVETSPSSAKHSGSRLKRKQYPKKLSRNRHTRSPSSTSTESSVDADSESCSSSNSGTSSSGSPTFHKYKRSSSSPGRRRARVGSAGSRDSRNKESESMTDVSPLSSPDISPLQSFDLNHGEADGGSLKEEEQQQQQQEAESVPSGGLSNIHHNETLDQDVDECSFTSESQLGGKLDFRYSGGKNRKNYSFRNEEVRRIDQENQRLLRALSRLSVGSRPKSASGKRTSKAGLSPVVRHCPSALNRQREQKRIERENLALLKRLESAKPTQSLRRSEQLAHYQRQTGYLEGSKFSVSPRSATHHRSGPVPTITPVPGSKQLGAARPAWC